MVSFIITGNNYKGNALPSYNDYITQCRANKWGANAWKHKFQKTIAKQIETQCDKFYIDTPFTIDMIICEGSHRRDKDNVEGMAKKLLLDTLQDNKYIKNDKLYMGGYTTFIYKRNNSYIQLTIQ